MALNTVGDYTLVNKLIPGYAAPALTKNLSLLNAGVLQSATIGGLGEGGNLWQVRGYKEYTTHWTRAVAATDRTIKTIGTYTDKGAILRAGDSFGVEDVSRFAGGDGENAYAQFIGGQIGQSAGLGTEVSIFTYELPGLFLASGILRSSHLIESDGTLSPTDVIDAKAVPGEQGGRFTKMFMHSDVHAEYEKNELISYSDVARREYMEKGLTYGGRIGGLDVIINDRCYNSGSTYHTYLMAPGSIFLGVQRGLLVEYERLPRMAGGSDVWTYSLYISPHVLGTSYTGTATGLAGVTDAELATVGNWTKRSGITDGEIGIVAIESTV